MAKDIRNNTVKPKPGTTNRRIWDISDLYYALGEKKLRREVLAQCMKEKISLKTASTEHSMWRRYMGLIRNLTKRGNHDVKSIGSI